MNTLLQNTFYFLVTLFIVNFCSKEQFASNWLIRVYSSAYFASQNVQLLGTLCSPTPFASKNFSANLLLNTLCSLADFAPWNTFLCFFEHSAPQPHLLLRNLCFSAHFAPQHTLLLNTLCSSEPFDPQITLIPGTLCSM